MRPTCKQTAEDGFSLLEAVISAAILSLALTAFFNAGAMGLRGASQSAQRTEAVLELQSLITRLGHDIPLTEGVLEGTTELGRPFSLSIALADKGERTGLGAYEIHADIARSAAKPNTRVSITTLKTARVAP